MSKSLPWMEVSKALDGSLPGDVSTHPSLAPTCGA
jgi:hypothetical protein